MNAPVLHFTPRAELGPLANLEAWIEMCRHSGVLNASAQFERNVWDIGYFKGQNKLHRAVFSTLEASRQDDSEPSLPPPFLDFAKAMLVYLQDTRPVTSQAVRICALRCLEAALRELNKASRPTAIDEEVLDTATELAREHQSPAVAYRIAGQLQLIAEFMRAKGFVPLRQRWTHDLKKPQEPGSRISKAAIAARQEKLPSAAALRALGGIFHEAVEGPDVMVSSVTAVLLCAPERINEALRLRRNCLVDGDGEFRGKLGLRWAGSKGFSNTTKWLPTEMAPIAREAISNLIEATARAQELAEWYTAHPKKLYVHDGAVHLRGREVLTPAEIALLLWGDANARVQANYWAQTTKGLKKESLGGRNVGYRFKDVERAVIEMLPRTFPYVPGAPELLCKDALVVVLANEMHSDRATYLCMFSCLDYGVVTNCLGAREGRSSIFERFAYREDDGSAIELQSHSLRHYLNMLAQMGGMSSAEIAIFSGRKDTRHNRNYDHMSSDEVQAPISQALKSGFTSNLVSAVNAGRELIARSEFTGRELTAAHTTEYGWCPHNFASEPCQMYRDCLNCEEHECVKGDAHKEANLRLLKRETEHLLNEAKEALSNEEYGADNWVRHQSKTLARVNALLAILEDPAIPPGARIRLDLSNAPLITDSDAHSVKVVKVVRRRTLQ